MKRRDLLKRELIITILFAFVLQTVGILLNIQNAQLGLVDFYVLSIPNNVLLSGILVWTMPIYVGLISRSYFIQLKGLKNYLFVRNSQMKIISIDVLRLLRRVFLLTVFLFIMCAVYLGLFFFIVDPGIGLSSIVQISRQGAMFGHLYLQFPLMYLCVFVLIFSSFSCLYALIGYYVSFYSNNRAFVLVSPLLVMIVSFMFFEIIPKGSVFSSGNFLYFSARRIVDDVSQFVSVIVSMVTGLCFLSTLIYLKARKDI